MKNIVLLGLVLGLTGVARAEHAHKAPHAGALVELGEHFAHLEVVLHAASGTVTVYVLDGEAEKPIRLKAKKLEIQVDDVDEKKADLKLELKPVASSLTGEKEGDTSEFSVQSDKLKDVRHFEGVLKEIQVKGKKFEKVEINFPTGNEGEKHDHKHDHDHKHEEKKK